MTKHDGVTRWMVLLAVLAMAPTVQAQQPWTLVGQGDTQFLVESEIGAQVFADNMQWIADNKETKNIAFLTQLGDLVDDGKYGKPNVQPPTFENQLQWQRAEAAVSILDNASFPWGTAVGNHEMDWVDVIPGVTPTSSNWWGAVNPGVPIPPSGFEEWKSRYGPVTSGRYDSVPEFGGAAANDVDTYFIYSAGGRDYLQFQLQFDVPDDTIAWAQGIIDANPGLPTIVSTHIFEGNAFGPPDSAWLPGPGRNSADQVWDKLIKDNSQIFMVLSAHVGGPVQQTRTNAAGEPVFTIAQDYVAWDHDRDNNGTDDNAGYLRLYEFDEANSVIGVKTYSPTLDQYLTNPGIHQFDLPLDFDQRFGAAPVPEPTTVGMVVVGVCCCFLRYRGRRDKCAA